MAGTAVSGVEGGRGAAGAGSDAAAPKTVDDAWHRPAQDDVLPDHGDGEGERGPTPGQDDGGEGASDTDAMGSLDTDEDAGVAPVRGVTLIDPDRLARALGEPALFGDPDDGPEPTSQEDEQRLRFLRRYAGSRSLFRPCLVADDGMIARLRALRAGAPNAARMVEVVERAALASRHAGSPLSMPPILAVGPPGTGKTTVARKIADALGTALTIIDGGATKDQGPWVGHDVGYRGSGPSHVARALLEGRTASPALLVDEIDKVSGYNYGVQPLDSLLALLEPGTARTFTDNYVGLPMRADHILWLMTANAIHGLPAPLLDRVVVVDVQRLGPIEARAVVQRILADLLAGHGLPAAELGRDALKLLENVGLRQARRILSLAIGPALAAGRDAPDMADVADAVALLRRPAPRPARARRPPDAKPRDPVGFVRFSEPSGPEARIGRDPAHPRRRV